MDDTTTMCDDANAVGHRFCIGSDALTFFLWYKPTLQFLVMGGDTGRASVFIALQSLNAAQRKHEATC